MWPSLTGESFAAKTPPPPPPPPGPLAAAAPAPPPLPTTAPPVADPAAAVPFGLPAPPVSPPPVVSPCTPALTPAAPLCPRPAARSIAALDRSLPHPAKARLRAQTKARALARRCLLQRPVISSPLNQSLIV